MIDLSKCPRCNENWVHSNYYCVICNMEYNGTYGKGCFVLSFNSQKLYWYRTLRRCCLYYMLDNSNHQKVINLPYLPYNISFTKLKLYLTLL